MHRSSTSRWLHGDYVARGKKGIKKRREVRARKNRFHGGFSLHKMIRLACRFDSACLHCVRLPRKRLLRCTTYLPTHLPTYLSTYLPVSFFHTISFPLPLAQTCWPTYLIRLQGFELAAFLTEWRLDIPCGVNRWQKAR